MNEPRPLSDIPNEEGFRVLLFHKATGLTVPAVVAREAKDIPRGEAHFLVGESGYRKALPQFSGWLPDEQNETR